MTDIVPRCAICAYWIAGAPQVATALEGSQDSAEIGNCTFNPPMVTVLPRRNYASTIFAQTHASRLCGEWVPAAGRGDPGEQGGKGTIIQVDFTRRRRRGGA